MLHVYAVTDIRDGSLVALHRSIHGTEITLIGHATTLPHLAGSPLTPGDLEAALAETAWIMVDYPAHEHAGRQVAPARLKVSREYLGA